MNHAIKYVANLNGVREVSLLGAANLAYWQDRLAKEELTPFAKDGHAQILVIAADARFLGVRFRELSFSVLVANPADGNGQAGAYLVQAFNSRRLLAFCERTFFSTPYSYGAVNVSAALPVSAEVAFRGQPAFRAEMGATGRQRRKPASDSEAGWEGPVHLPGSRRGKRRTPKLFFAKVHGQTQSYPFSPGKDLIAIRPSSAGDVFTQLIESGFVGLEWSIRENATHAKSKTYARSEILPQRQP